MEYMPLKYITVSNSALWKNMIVQGSKNILKLNCGRFSSFPVETGSSTPGAIL